MAREEEIRTIFQGYTDNSRLVFIKRWLVSSVRLIFEADVLSEGVLLVTVCTAANCMSSRHSKNVVTPRASISRSIQLNGSLRDCLYLNLVTFNTIGFLLCDSCLNVSDTKDRRVLVIGALGWSDSIL